MLEIIKRPFFSQCEQKEKVQRSEQKEIAEE